jgi:serine/threonine protein kinase
MLNESLDELLDRLVAEYSDRCARGVPRGRQELLQQVDDEHRPELARCFDMIDAGLTAPPSSAAVLAAGTELDGYRIEKLLGRGGMAMVYSATELRLERAVALKVLRVGLAADPRQVERFRREAIAVARLRHPNILQVYAVGEAAGHHYIAMEYLDGCNLGQLLQQLPRTRPPRAEELADCAGIAALGDAGSYERAIAMLLAPAVGAVAAAHRAGVLHRDLKPSNILVGRDGRVKVADFGLAKEGGDPVLSLTGEPIGTPYYMSPEQVLQHSRTLDGRTDVYSLGVTLFECLTGERPFQGDTVYAVFDAIRTASPPRLRALAPECSADAQAVVSRAMARDPNDRYATAEELAADLERLARGEATAARAQQGGWLRRATTQLGALLSGRVVEYRSHRTLLGLPLVHVAAGPMERGKPRRRARGWIAVGDVACGVIAFGKVRALGVVSCAGALSCGIVTAAGSASLGVLGFAGAAVVGVIALAGGCGIGYASFGGLAVGRYAMGGGAVGQHTISGAGADPEAVDWFAAHLPFLIDLWHYVTQR